LGQTVEAVRNLIVLLKKDYFSKFTSVSLIPKIFPKGGKPNIFSLGGGGNKFFKISRSGG